MSSIGETVDWSEFKLPDADVGQSKSDAALNKSPEDKGQEARGDSGELEAQEKSQPEGETKQNSTQEGTKQTDKTATNRTDNKVKQARAPDRIQELLTQNKEKDTKLAQLQQQFDDLSKSREQPQAKEAKSLVPKPTPPKYTREVLSQLEEKALAEGDQALVRQVQRELINWDKYDISLMKWEMEDKNAIQNHNGLINYYKNEALKKYEALKDPNSDHSKEYAGIRGWMSKELPELLDKPVGEYLLAQISGWKLGSSRLVAVESEFKKLREEHEKLKKDGQPLESTGKATVDKNNSNTLEDAKANLKSALKGQFGSQTFA